MYKYAVQDLHKKQVHVSSVPRHCIPSEISAAMRDGTETRSMHAVHTSTTVTRPINLSLSQFLKD